MATIDKLTSESKLNVSLLFEGPGLDGQTLDAIALNPPALSADPSSTPPASLYLAKEVVSASGPTTETIDLSDWTDSEGMAQDATGKKVQEIRFQADADNSAAATIAPAASDGYEFLGAGNQADVEPGGLLHLRGNDGLADVDASHKQIDVTVGPGDSATVEVILG